jgi:hypothetical protein
MIIMNRTFKVTSNRNYRNKKLKNWHRTEKLEDIGVMYLSNGGEPNGEESRAVTNNLFTKKLHCLHGV